MNAADVWLPVAADEIEGLPAPAASGLTYRFWDGGEEFPADPADCAFYVVPYMKPTETVVRPLAAMTSVQVVQTLTAGIDHVEPGLGSLRAGVRLCNAKGVHEASTAELALALVLASLRGIPRFVEGQRKEEWRSGFYPALADKSVLIVGYGSIGAAIEDRLTPFECARVARVARSARATERGQVHPLSQLPLLLPEADVVILSTPLTPGTHHLVNADFLGRMKDGALLVNVARGPVVDTKSLIEETATGRITAALDVTDPEPLPPGHPLWHAPGVLISPHVGGSTSAFLPRANRLMGDQLRRFATGEPLRNVVLTTR
ncbi:2-hydroxyacid dehydrogenase [Streptomyces sp. NPDC059828]|uniref:2-hydroxyacid dehydrogenase n=1 Tax=Streptomyces sp. NPDC059828 TaxID=3346965 RepID=UPI00365F7270